MTHTPTGPRLQTTGASTLDNNARLEKLPDRELQRQEPVEGELQCFTVDDPHLRRPVRIAKLTRTADARRPELIPPLYDADVITLGRTGAVITGIERLPADDGVVEFAQSWWIRFV